jgi:hypothetical protein
MTEIIPIDPVDFGSSSGIPAAYPGAYMRYAFQRESHGIMTAFQGASMIGGAEVHWFFTFCPVSSRDTVSRRYRPLAVLSPP